MSHAKACNAIPPCRTRDEMTRKHGTPAQFRKAAFNAVPSMLSYLEAKAGSDAYEAEWADAPQSAKGS